MTLDFSLRKNINSNKRERLKIFTISLCLFINKNARLVKKKKRKSQEGKVKPQCKYLGMSDHINLESLQHIKCVPWAEVLEWDLQCSEVVFFCLIFIYVKILPAPCSPIRD